jgi:4-hydroxybenzoate polyprenyltransferase
LPSLREIKTEMSKVRKYLSLIKFSHTIFAMPFAMVGFFLGLKHVEKTKNILSIFKNSSNQLLILLLLVILCMVFARSAAMAFNRYLDKNFDAKNPRTAIREIPSGVLKAENVLLFTIANCLLFIVTTFFINKICFYLSPVALAVVLGYSYTKRFTPLCHLVLGLGLSLAPIGAFLAVTGHFDLLPILFSFTVLFWVSGFDIIYALQDEEFDKENNLYSMPAAMGKARALFFSRILHFLSICCLVIAGWLGDFSSLYWTGTIIFTGMLIYQHTIVKPDDLKKVNIAFMTANGIASVLFAIFVITDLFLNF